MHPIKQLNIALMDPKTALNILGLPKLQISKIIQKTKART